LNHHGNHISLGRRNAIFQMVDPRRDRRDPRHHRVRESAACPPVPTPGRTPNTRPGVGLSLRQASTATKCC
jgi:hypothetical protein